MAISEESEQLHQAIQDLYDWQYGDPDSPSFAFLIFSLFQKADARHLRQLRRGFPAHYMAWKMWKGHSDQETFFKFWKIIPDKRREGLDGQPC